MPKAKTAIPLPPQVVLGFADLNERAVAVLEALNRIDLDQADRLRHTIEVLDGGSDPDESFDWRWKSGLADFVDVMAAIRKLADSCIRPGDDPVIGACTGEQVTELVAIVRAKAPQRRAKAIRRTV